MELEEMNPLAKAMNRILVRDTVNGSAVDEFLGQVMLRPHEYHFFTDEVKKSYVMMHHEVTPFSIEFGQGIGVGCVIMEILDECLGPLV